MSKLKIDYKESLLTAQKYIAQLEQENAELKAKNKWYSEQVCNKECSEVWGQLEHAKEIIKLFVQMEYNDFTNGDCSNELSKVLKQAEQFIREIENA